MKHNCSANFASTLAGSLKQTVGSLVFLLLVAMPAAPALAAGAVPIPSGFRFFCHQHPEECRGGGASSVTYSPQLLATLAKVNAQVNRSITPKKEDLDVWSINVSQGDCEEYVLAKRRALISAGIPASSLSIVYALRNGGGHAILAVHTTLGTLTLDNKSPEIRPLHKTGYRIISMSGPNPLVWHRP